MIYRSIEKKKKVKKNYESKKRKIKEQEIKPVILDGGERVTPEREK